MDDPVCRRALFPSYRINVVSDLSSKIDTLPGSGLTDLRVSDLLTCAAMIIDKTLRVRVSKLALPFLEVIMARHVLALLAILDLLTITVCTRRLVINPFFYPL